ncbi:hypothetical protein LR032_04015, partial [Candidatus Bipolaricaulota bacterium]|nr:hypothetical protein [Candidatus Bipolaricaulota bacterium]
PLTLTLSHNRERGFKAAEEMLLPIRQQVRTPPSLDGRGKGRGGASQPGGCETQGEHSRRAGSKTSTDPLKTPKSLIDAFDLLMEFVAKHLNDPFYQEGLTSISLRSIIFRELVANIIAHREYTSAAPATMMIYRNRVEFKNPNVPHYHGKIDPDHFTPFPKNPTICKFMIQIGRYEELGSGVRRVNQYLPHYTPGATRVVFDDGDMFTVTVPVSEAKAPVTPEVTPEVNKDAHGDPGRNESHGNLTEIGADR